MEEESFSSNGHSVKTQINGVGRAISINLGFEDEVMGFMLDKSAGLKPLQIIAFAYVKCYADPLFFGLEWMCSMKKC